MPVLDNTLAMSDGPHFSTSSPWRDAEGPQRRGNGRGARAGSALDGSDGAAALGAAIWRGAEIVPAGGAVTGPRAASREEGATEDGQGKQRHDGDERRVRDAEDAALVAASVP
jgi:hypothetical protein